MFFTRCPDCATTFRVTDEALQKAHGQVRCGRCASVFNAYSELRDPATGAQITVAGVAQIASSDTVFTAGGTTTNTQVRKILGPV